MRKKEEMRRTLRPLTHVKADRARLLSTTPVKEVSVSHGKTMAPTTPYGDIGPQAAVEVAMD